MNTSLTRTRIRNAINKKRIIVVKHIKEEEVLPTETRLIPLDIVEEIRGIAKNQAYLIGFRVDIIPSGLIQETDFRRFPIEAINEIRITSRVFDPEEPVRIYRMMKRSPTVAWMIQRNWNKDSKAE